MSELDKIIQEIFALIEDEAENSPQSVDPDLADHMGAFEEDALDQDAALLSLLEKEDLHHGRV